MGTASSIMQSESMHKENYLLFSLFHRRVFLRMRP